MTRTFNWRIVFRTMGVLTMLEAQFMLIPTIVAWFYHEADFGAWIASCGVTWLSSWWMLAAGRNAESSSESDQHTLLYQKRGRAVKIR